MKQPGVLTLEKINPSIHSLEKENDQKTYTSHTYWPGKSKSSYSFGLRPLASSAASSHSLTHTLSLLSTFLCIISELKYILLLSLDAAPIDLIFLWEDDLFNTNAREIQCQSTTFSDFSQNTQLPFIRCESNRFFPLLPMVL